MKLKPVITEKSLSQAKEGYYTFLVNPNLKKPFLKKIIGETFDVDVIEIKTMRSKTLKRKNYQGKIVKKKGQKKVIVTLKEKQKIDLFEEKKKKQK